MNMDAYHKMLVKIYEAAGGRESVDVDFVEIVKREGYFPSIEEISNYLRSESWVTESRPNVFRLTHWGIAEVKRSLSNQENGVSSFSANKEKLAALAAELSKLVDGLSERNAADSVKKIKSVSSDITEAAEQIK
ncbi:MAG: hypothetical protein JNL64_06150 [Blastocatellia bacterium]|nr:hypothetical protein [Blastocatellia bacterium]